MICFAIRDSYSIGQSYQNACAETQRRLNSKHFVDCKGHIQPVPFELEEVVNSFTAAQGA